MPTSTKENTRHHQGVVLSSPKEDTNNWKQYKFSMEWMMCHKRLCYLLNPIPVQNENGIPVSAEVKERDAEAFCALLMESIHEDDIFLIKDCTTPKEMWLALQ